MQMSTSGELNLIIRAWRKAKINEVDWPAHARIFLEGSSAAAKAVGKTDLANVIDVLIDDLAERGGVALNDWQSA